MSQKMCTHPGMDGMSTLRDNIEVLYIGKEMVRVEGSKYHSQLNDQMTYVV